MIKATVIIKDVSEVFFDGNGSSITGLLNMSDADKFKYLQNHSLGFPVKIANGSFRDRVDLNSLTKRPHTIAFKIEPRRGYKLATFTFTA